MTMLAALLGTLPAGCHSPPTSDPISITVTVVPARAGLVEQWATLVGSMVARQDVLVSSEVSGGRILTLSAEVGDHVDADQALIQFDDRSMIVQISENEAEVRRTESALKQVQTQVTLASVAKDSSERALLRAEKLSASGSIAFETLEAQRAAAAEAQARLEAANAAVAVAEAECQKPIALRGELELNRHRTRITSPCAGLIVERKAVVGAVVQTGEALFRIAKDGEIEFAAEAPEAILDSLSTSTEVSVEVGGVVAPANVRRLDPIVDPSTRVGLVRIALSEGLTVRPRIGSSAIARVCLRREQGLVIPDSAAQRPNAQAFVFVTPVAPDANGLVRVSRRVIGIGITDGHQVRVTSGLNEGDLVVAVAAGFLVDGEMVYIDRHGPTMSQAP